MPHSRTLPTPSLPHPTHGLTFYGAATVRAPAATIWSTLLDLPSYPAWSPFTPFPTPLPSRVKSGLELQFQARPSARNDRAKSVRVRIERVDEGVRRVCWVRVGGGGVLRWLGGVRREGVVEVVDFGDGACEVRGFETVVGWGVRVFGGRLLGEGGEDEALRVWAEELGEEVGRRMGRGRGEVVNPERRVGEGWVGDVGDGEDGDDDDDDDDD